MIRNTPDSPVTFSLDGFHNRVHRDWSKQSGTVRAGSCWNNARKHAAQHGAAGVWRADDSFVLFYRVTVYGGHDGREPIAKVRRQTWKHARPRRVGEVETAAIPA